MVVPSLLLLFGLGFISAVVLAVASKVLYVYEDPLIGEVERALLGANCGGCGYPGCGPAAQAVVRGEAGVTVCVAGGPDIAEAVARVMGKDMEFAEPELARVDCTGGERAEEIYLYEGVQDCRAQALLHGGVKTCGEGCLGLGSCVRACPFDAIHMGPAGYPVVDMDLCRACNQCVEACPRGVMVMFSLSQRLLHLNLNTDCVAPCRQMCPAQIDIPRKIDYISQGDFEAAVKVVKERMPLLLTCGRVCPRPCETVCRRGVAEDPVAINMLKRFVADFEYNSGRHYPVECLPDTGHKVAIIGGGPAGLSCAYFLRRLGHQPVIFEAMDKLGGQIRYGIPYYRLPEKVLDWEIEGILRLGIEVKTGVRFGQDVDLKSLEKDGFEAVFLGLGAWESSSLRCEGENAHGVMHGTEFLTAVGLGRPVDPGERIVVVGGGNTAMDVARTAVRLGSKDVIMMYRRTEAEMPANEEEIHGAREEGVQFMFLAAPTRIITDDKNNATHIEYVKMELGEPDASGRRRPIPIQGSETLLEVDTIVPAIGQKPDISCLYEDGSDTCSVEITKWRTVMANEITQRTMLPNVFTAGDMQTGADLVVTAVGGGRRAARSIHYFLTQGDIPVPEHVQTRLIPDTLFTDLPGVHPIPRAPLKELCADDRKCGFDEIEAALTVEEAQTEACRCLRCGLICYDEDVQKPIVLPDLRPEGARRLPMTRYPEHKNLAR